MGRMSKEEFEAWKEDPVEIPIQAVIKQTSASLILKVQEDEYPVGMSVIENLEDLQKQLRRTVENQERSGDLVVVVPRWLAHNNGWEDDEPPEW